MYLAKNGENVRAMINKGYTRATIAKELGVGTTTLDKYLKANNLKTNGHRTDITGQKFGKLTVLEKVGYSKNHKSRYLCKCDCGTIKIIVGGNLSSGDTISCGCDKGISKYKESVYQRNLAKIGEKHGRLTIIDIKYNQEKQEYFMICRCECGTISEKNYSSIKKGHTISCGCYMKEMVSKKASTRSWTKNRWYFIKDGLKFKCRSSYEVIYANYLIVNGIDFEYEPQIFKLGEGKRYTPDFYIVKDDLYIEIKGISYDVYDKYNQKKRYDLFKQIHSIEIYHWNDLVSMCNLPYKTYKGFKDNANKLNITIEEYLGEMLYM